MLANKHQQYIRNLTIQKQARLKSSMKQQQQHFLDSFLATNQTALEKRGATCLTGKPSLESTIQGYEGRLVSTPHRSCRNLQD